MSASEPHAAPATCENCSTVLVGAHCHVCGQHAHSPLRHFGHAVEDVFESFWHLDGRIFRTLRDLFVPGRVAAQYLAGHRVRYVAPLRLFVILSLLTFFVGKLTLHLDPDTSAAVRANPQGIIDLDDDRISDSQIDAATTATEVLAIRGRLLADIGQARDDPQTNAMLAGVFDFTQRRIDARASARMRALGATPDQLRQLDTLPAAAPAGDARSATAAATTATAPAAADGGLLRRWVTRKLERMQANAALVESDPDELVRRVLAAVPGALFVLVPLFALCLKVLYVRSRRGYLEHLVVALYSHAFMLVALLATFLLIGLQALRGLPAWGAGLSAFAASLILSLAVPVYLLAMQKRVYGQHMLKTLVKYAALGMIYSFLLGMAIVYAVLAGLSS